MLPGPLLAFLTAAAPACELREERRAGATVFRCRAAAAAVSPVPAPLLGLALCAGGVGLREALGPGGAWLAGAAACAALWAARGRRAVREQTLLVCDGVGVQLESANWFGQLVERRFVDAAQVRAVVINELVTNTNVHYCLQLLVAGRAELEVAFPDFILRLADLKRVRKRLLADLGCGDLDPSGPELGALLGL